MNSKLVSQYVLKRPVCLFISSGSRLYSNIEPAYAWPTDMGICHMGRDMDMDKV